MLMVTFTMVTGRTIKLMDSDSTHILMELNMKGTGLTTNSMARVRNIGLMAHNMREIINLVKKMDMVHSFGLISHLTRETLSTIIFMETALTSGRITESIPATG